MLRGGGHDRADDARVLREQVVAAHPRLAGEARRDHDDVAAGRVRVVVRARHPGVVADHRGRLGQVEALALGQPVDDVHEDDVGETGFRDSLGRRRADVPGSDDGDLVACHERVVLLRIVPAWRGRRRILCPTVGPTLPRP